MFILNDFFIAWFGGWIISGVVLCDVFSRDLTIYDEYNYRRKN